MGAGRNLQNSVGQPERQRRYQEEGIQELVRVDLRGELPRIAPVGLSASSTTSKEGDILDHADDR